MKTPKSDMERFIELYKSFGIDLKPEKRKDDDYDVSLNDSISDKFVGYMGFSSTVIFDKDGNFIRQGFWE